MIGFPGEDRTAHSTALSRLPSHVPLGITLHDLRPGRGFVEFHLAERLGLLAFLFLKLLALHFHLALLRRRLIYRRLLHLVLLLLGLLLLLLAWASLPSPKPR